MKSESELGKIKAPLFLAGLVTLLLNDFYLKYAYPNDLTGKLSDFAGLFIFPFFFSAFRPQSKKSIYLATAVVFIIWKSEISQPWIEFMNSIGIGIYRTVDYSDFLAVTILPLSYRYFKNEYYSYANNSKISTASLAAISLFSFCATSLPRQEVEIRADTDKTFVLNLSKAEVFSRLSSTYSNTNTFKETSKDSLFYLYFDIDDLKADVTAVAEIYSIGPNRTVIKLDSVSSAYITGGLFSGVDQEDMDRMKVLKPAELETYFETYFVKKLENNSSENYLYYKIKEIQDGKRNNNRE